MLINFYFVDEAFEVGVGVGIAVGEIDLVIIIGIGILPSEGIERFILHTTFAIAILIIIDLITSSMPTNIFFLAFPFTINNNFHPHLI